MDRLICGDVGFGKSAGGATGRVRAAMKGKQVAVVVPTTLLARQHTKTFTERFHGLPAEDCAGFAASCRRAEELDEVKAGLKPTATSIS